MTLIGKYTIEHLCLAILENKGNKKSEVSNKLYSNKKY